MTEPSELDCQACGACCHGDEGWVHVDRDDEPRISASSALASLVVLTRLGAAVRRSLRMIDGHCAALARTATGVTCTIYADRPAVCRSVTAGSTECLTARRARGFEAGASSAAK